MKTLRDYLSIIEEQNLLAERVVPGQETPPGVNRLTGQPNAPAAAPAAAAAATSPWANDPTKDAAWKTLSPEDQKWLGGADPTDKAILARAPNKGAPAPAAAPAPVPAAPAAVPAPVSAAQSERDDAAAVDAAAAAAPATATPVAPQTQVAGTPITTPAAPAPAQSGQAAGNYQIKPGDNLTKIAKANGTTIQAIMAANPTIKDPNKIIAGKSLVLPPKAAAPAPAAAAPAAAPAAAAPAPAEQRTPDEVKASADLGDFAGESVVRESQALARIIQLARG